MTKLLSEPKSNPKIAKNMAKAGVLTAPLHLAPYNLSGYQVCPMASKGCAAACLNTAGRGRMNSVQEARIRKTKLFYTQREDFLATIVKEVATLERRALKHKMLCGVRLNATSDIPWEAYKVTYKGKVCKNIMEAFPKVQFYDYTKVYKRAKTTKGIPNYHLTFSLAEDNDANAEKALLNGMNVAVVFDTKDLPDTYTIGKTTTKVIDGDEHDFRPLDGKHSKGIIVGLKAKGDAKKDTSGFVRKVAAK